MNHSAESWSHTSFFDFSFPMVTKDHVPPYSFLLPDPLTLSFYVHQRVFSALLIDYKNGKILELRCRSKCTWCTSSPMASSSLILNFFYYTFAPELRVLKCYSCLLEAFYSFCSMWRHCKLVTHKNRSLNLLMWLYGEMQLNFLQCYKPCKSRHL